MLNEKSNEQREIEKLKKALNATLKIIVSFLNDSNALSTETRQMIETVDHYIVEKQGIWGQVPGSSVYNTSSEISIKFYIIYRMIPFYPTSSYGRY